jgi:asparaginyl-tRNA synthetase
MDGTRIADVLGGKVAVGAAVAVQGWLRTRRDTKAGLSFLQVHDGSCFASLQVIAESTLPNYEAEIRHAGTGCAVRVAGVLVASPAAGQAVELRATEVTIIGWVEAPDTYPMQPKRHTPEFLRDVAHLRPRTNLIGAVTRVRNTLAFAVHSFFQARGFSWIHTPILTGSDAEGAGQMFRVSTLDLVNPPRTATGNLDWSQDFFGKPAHLTVSGQLNVECYCLAMSRVYTFGPTFRAENSNTRRHLAEFWMIEPEIAFADLAVDAQLATEFLAHIFRAVLEQRQDDLAFFAERVDAGVVRRLERFVDAPSERMTYTEAVARLEASGAKFEFPVFWGCDLQSEHERWLCEQVGGPVIVTDYPAKNKAFYMRMNEDGRTVAAMDVLAPGVGEIIGGSQREERLEQLDARIVAMGLNPADYGWYRDLRRYGTVPHAGFGLGFERAVMYATGVENIRESIPFPRAVGRLDF